MKQWFTNAELAAMELPGFPATEPGVSAWFKKRDIDNRFPNKVRRRKGRGGGVERHISLLPSSLQSLISIRQIKETPEKAVPAPFAGSSDIPEPACNEHGERRRAAVLLVLNFWDIYRSKSSLPQEVARSTFVALYRNRKLEGLPEWVPEALKSRSGNDLKLSAGTLRNWERKRDSQKFSQLGGAYGNRRGSGVLQTANGGKVADLIAALIARQPHLSADHLRDLVRAEFGDELDRNGKPVPVPPIRTFQRFIASWKEEHAESLMKLTDPDAFRNRKRMTGTNMNHWVERPNQLWEIDASPADVLCTDGRYSIYVIVDIHTRRICASVTRTPRTQAALLLVRKAITAWGVPEIIRTDNGADFISYEFRQALTALAIHQDITAPFSPEQKGTVERHIGTVQRGFMSLLPGFVGHNVADRKQIEARKSFAQRLGESDKNAFCVELTHEDLQRDLDRWIASKYEHKAHGGLKGRTPFETAAAWSAPLRRVEDERLLDILLAPVAGKDGFRTVTRQGIALDRARFLHSAMVPGERVFCRHDPEDMGRIYVFSEDRSTFLYVAECPDRLNTNPGDAVRELRAEQKRRTDEDVAPLKRKISRMKPRDMIDKVLAVSERDSAVVTAFPQRSEPHITPEMEAAADVVAVGRDGYVPEATPMTPDERRLHETTIADLNQRRREKIEAEMPADLARFRLALDIEAMIERGEEPSDYEKDWLSKYSETPEYRSYMGMYQDFGDQLFG
jgi:transposase InsO family protein